MCAEVNEGENINFLTNQIYTQIETICKEKKEAFDPNFHKERIKFYVYKNFPLIKYISDLFIDTLHKHITWEKLDHMLCTLFCGNGAYLICYDHLRRNNNGEIVPTTKNDNTPYTCKCCHKTFNDRLEMSVIRYDSSFASADLWICSECLYNQQLLNDLGKITYFKYLCKHCTCYDILKEHKEIFKLLHVNVSIIHDD